MSFVKIQDEKSLLIVDNFMNKTRKNIDACRRALIWSRSVLEEIVESANVNYGSLNILLIRVGDMYEDI